ncbi:hypothetical protein [Streptomyces melanogenes]|uniref:hypothetical protein n=1 Tax=Streptomyces melanogenes TaxID=67326 RepID=UPI00378D4348
MRSHAAGNAWLANAAPVPAAVHRAWVREELAAIPTGGTWIVAEAPIMASVEAMQRIGSARLGPVLAAPESDRAWWLLPLDATEHLADVRRLTLPSPGWLLHCPPCETSLDGRCWLERPDGTGRLTDPALLGAAFGPAGRLPAEAFG